MTASAPPSLPSVAADPDAVPGRATHGDVVVLYIAGMGRSGSTLLDRTLGQIPGFVSAGEKRELWRFGLEQNGGCGCGEPFRDCEFWSAVGQVAFGGWDQIDPVEMQELTRRVDRFSHLPLHVFPWLPRSYRHARDTYVDVVGRLTLAMAAVADAQIVVDSSKSIAHAMLLRRHPGVDVRLVHLVRDSRAVVHSWQKRVDRPDMPGKQMARPAPTLTAARWMTRNLAIQINGSLGVPRVGVRYERLATAPEHEVQRIMELVRDRYPSAAVPHLSGTEVDLRPAHIVQGNPMKFQLGPVPFRLDDAWRSSMPRGQRRLVTALTLPLLLVYRYVPERWAAHRPARST